MEALHKVIVEAIEKGLVRKGDHYHLIIVDENEYQFFREGDVPTNYVYYVKEVE